MEDKQLPIERMVTKLLTDESFLEDVFEGDAFDIPTLTEAIIEELEGEFQMYVNQRVIEIHRERIDGDNGRQTVTKV